MIIGMNIDNLKNIVDKLKMYNNEEIINFNNILNSLENINANYKTKNYNNLLSIKEQLDRKFEIIKKDHYLNEVILVTNIQKQIDTIKKSNISLDKLK